MAYINENNKGNENLTNYQCSEVSKIGWYSYTDCLKHIPNHEYFFLLNDIYSCKPAPLIKSDKTHFNRKCRNLVKERL